MTHAAAPDVSLPYVYERSPGRKRTLPGKSGDSERGTEGSTSATRNGALRIRPERLRAKHNVTAAVRVLLQPSASYRFVGGVYARAVVDLLGGRENGFPIRDCSARSVQAARPRACIIPTTLVPFDTP